jgi:acyl carrier protein
MPELVEELKQLIIDSLRLEDVAAADIDASAPLFNEGLGLDSIDALELGVALQKRFGLRFDSNAEEMRSHFASVTTLAEFVSANRK